LLETPRTLWAHDLSKFCQWHWLRQVITPFQSAPLNAPKNHGAISVAAFLSKSSLKLFSFWGKASLPQCYFLMAILCAIFCACKASSVAKKHCVCDMAVSV